MAFKDPACDFAYCDYSLFWLAGDLARQGQAGAVYHGAAFFAFAGQALPGHVARLPFLYPPVMLLPAAVMSLPGLAAGYYGFSLVVVLAAVLLLRWARLRWRVIAIGVLSPAAMWSLYLGQFGLICGALLIAGLARLQDRPKVSGGMLGLLSVKPQYALLVPVVVLAGRYWRAMLAGVVVLAVLLAGCTLAFGWQGWVGFLGAGRVAASAVLEAPFGPGYARMGVSVFWMLRSFGAAVPGAYAGQALAAAGCVALVWRLWRRDVGDQMARAAVTVFLTLLASPYGFVDDMTAYSIMLPVLARREAPWRNLCLAVLWLAPAFVLAVAKMFGVSLGAVLVVAAVGVAGKDGFGLTRMTKENIGQVG